MKRQFKIETVVTIRVSTVIEADSLEEAKNEGTGYIEDTFNLHENYIKTSAETNEPGCTYSYELGDVKTTELPAGG